MADEYVQCNRSHNRPDVYVGSKILIIDQVLDPSDNPGQERFERAPNVKK
jgi:hypothetical protein